MRARPSPVWHTGCVLLVGLLVVSGSTMAWADTHGDKTSADKKGSVDNKDTADKKGSPDNKDSADKKDSPDNKDAADNKGSTESKRPSGDGKPAPAPPTPATPPKPPSRAARLEARRLFRAGARAYDATKYEVAAQLFDQAYALVPRAALRFSAAQALRRQYAITRDIALLERALRYYRQYLAEVKQGRRVADAADAANALEIQLSEHRRRNGGTPGPDPSAGTPPTPPPPRNPTGTLQLDSPLPGATATIAGMPAIDQLPYWADLKPGLYQVTVQAPGYVQKTRSVRVEQNRTTVVDGNLPEQPAQLTVKADDGADVLVDGRVVGEGPAVGPLTLSSGAHRIVVGDSGRQVVTRDVKLVRGKAQELKVDLAMTPQRVTAWVFTVASCLTLVNAGVFTGLSIWRQSRARQLRDEADSTPRTLTPDERDEYNGHLSTRDRQNVVAASSYVLAGLSGGVALLLFELDNPNLFEAAQGSPSEDEPDPDTDGEGMPTDIEASITPLSAGPSSVAPVGGMLILNGRF